MKIKATRTDFEKWIDCVPLQGDLLFLSKECAEVLEAHSFSVNSRSEIKTHIESLWGLNSCTWYCYALARADYWIWLPLGTLETLERALIIKLAEEQISFGVPTVLKAILPSELKGKLLELPIGSWITSSSWSRLSKEEQVSTIQLWSIQNEINEYDSIELESLPGQAWAELSRIGFDTLVNRFQKISGPNCFAAVAGAIAFDDRHSLSIQWLHWPHLEERLIGYKYEVVELATPKVGDVLIFRENDMPVHASYFIGDGLYFEKPGQDFFEPYRIQEFEKWRDDWPRATLSLFRRSV